MLFDLHNDYPTAMPCGKRLEYAKRMAKHGITVTAAVFTSELNACSVLSAVEDVKSELSPMRVEIPISIEDLGFLSDDGIDTFDFSSFFYCSLTWNNDNAFAGGALGEGKLTERGRRLINAMNGKCAVDLAHLNKRSFFDVLDCAERPVCSHTGFTDHPRCLDERQICALVERKVIIGLSAVTKFSGAGSAAQFAAVIDGFVQRHGCDSLSIGTDFNGSTDFPPDLSDYSAFDTVKSELNKLGYTDGDCEKIFYGNAKQFYKEIVSERHI